MSEKIVTFQGKLPVAAHERVWGMTHSTWGYLIWGLVAAAVLGVELSAKDITGLAPWPSLSYTLKKLIEDHHWVALTLLLLLVTFLVHILNPGKWGV
jgi:aromatic ring-opening dioxygenase catalytic subunit (LigB family)